MNTDKDPNYTQSLLENKKDEEEKKLEEDEHYRLGGRGPLKTLLILTVGPLISQLVSGLYGVITSMWISKAMGDKGMSAISIYSNLDNIGRAFGFFMLTTASSKISALFGELKGEEAGQVICDLIRVSILCGIFVPAVLTPASKPLGRWFGAKEDIIDLGFQYLTPLNCFCFVTCIYLLMCGCLQAEGRSNLVAITQVCSLVANMGLFCPLFVVVFKWQTLGAAIATVVSEFIPGFLVLTLFFCGKFGVKPKLSGLFKKFSPHTLPALKVGISQLIMNLSRSIPSIFLRKFMGLCAEKSPEGDFENAIAGFNAVTRIFGITDSVRLAVSMGLLPAASYAFTSHRYLRIFHLIGHSCWLNLIWGVSTTLLTAFDAKLVAMSISSSPEYLKYATPMLRISNWEAPFSWIRNVCQTILQALQYGTTATVYMLTATFCTYIGALLLLYYTNDHDFIRMMYTFPISSGLAVVVGMIIVIFPLRKIWKERDPNENAKGIESKNTLESNFVDVENRNENEQNKV
ncbi:MatE family protein [Histomonas meleagridis]|uniref:MatE family protein n=1 Tax=Histomonas meleagridis TaxID=135588 RepID=UPI00355A9BC0|nr:MatE family protein [Histomonas meleagridis]KAH0797172.1 MatE family protein [Histomonas meleagridis]